MDYQYHTDSMRSGNSYKNQSHLDQNDVLQALKDPSIPGLPVIR